MFTNNKWKSLLAISALLLVTGCSSDKKVEQPKEPKSVATSAETEVTYSAPLTGEKTDAEVVQRPAIVVINNHPAARPQSGIGSADIIYEMVAEGNVTRLLAVFQSELPENIGPVRSARDYFIDIAQGYDAFFVAHGYSPEAKKLLTANVVDNINGMNYDGTLFQRSLDRVAPHNSYITGQDVLKGAEKVNASMIYQKKVNQTFYNGEENVKIGLDAKKIDVRYGNSESYHNSYKYRTATNDYERASGGVTTVDALTNKPVILSNVVFLELPHYTVDSYGRQAIDLDNGGPAYVFQGGTMREVQWENDEGMLTLVEDDGSDVKLVTGKTWIHFVATSPGLAKVVTFESQ